MDEVGVDVITVPAWMLCIHGYLVLQKQTNRECIVAAVAAAAKQGWQQDSWL